MKHPGWINMIPEHPFNSIYKNSTSWSPSPKVSTIGNFFTMTCFLAIRSTPRTSVTMTTMGRPSGMAATARLDWKARWVTFNTHLRMIWIPTGIGNTFIWWRLSLVSPKSLFYSLFPTPWCTCLLLQPPLLWALPPAKPCSWERTSSIRHPHFSVN